MATSEALWRRLREEEEVLERILSQKSGGPTASSLADRSGELLLRAEQTLAEMRAALPTAKSAEAESRLEAAAARIAGYRTTRRALLERTTREDLFGKPKDKGEPAKPGSKEESDREALRHLTEARNHMGSTLGHIQEVQKQLDKTSETIDSTQSQYDIFSLKLKDAAQLLSQLKRRTEQDTKYIWWSFWFFICVCAYIVLRRLKVFRMVYLAFSWSYWSGATTVGFMQGTVAQLTAVGQAVGEALGLLGPLEVVELR